MGDGEYTLISGLNHEVRRRILRFLNAGKTEFSPTTLGEVLGLSLSDVSYHVTILGKCNMVALVKTEPVRGATKHFYTSTVADNEAVQALLEEMEAEDEAISRKEREKPGEKKTKRRKSKPRPKQKRRRKES